MLGGARPVGLDDPLPQGHRRPPCAVRLRCRLRCRLRPAGPHGRRHPARASRRPRSIRSRTARTTWPSASRVTSTTGRPRTRCCGEGGHHPLRLGLGGHRVGGQDQVDDDGVVGLALLLAHHQGSDVGGGRPVDRPAGVARAGRAGPRGAPRPRRAPAAGRPRSRSSGRRLQRGRLAEPRGHVQRPGQGRPRPPGPTTAARTARTEASSTTTASSTPRRAGVNTTSTSSGPRAGAGRPGRRARRMPGPTRTGPLAVMVSSTGRPASPSEGQPVQVTTARRAGNERGHQPGDQHRGQQGPDRLHPARSARVGHPGPGQRRPPRCRPPARTRPPGGAGDRSRRPSGNEERRRRRRSTGEHPPGDDHPGQHGQEPDDGAGDHDRGPEDGPDGDHRHQAGQQARRGGVDRAPHQGAAVGAPRAHVGGTGVSSTIRATRVGPSPPLPSAMSRWARQATATAWMSWGVT